MHRNFNIDTNNIDTNNVDSLSLPRTKDAEDFNPPYANIKEKVVGFLSFKTQPNLIYKNLQAEDSN